MSKIKFMKLSKRAKAPTQGSEAAAGYDLYAGALPDGRVEIQPGQVVKISTDIAVEIPRGFFGAIYPRSSLATKMGLRLANGVAVIDPDYRGSLVVPIFNDSERTQVLSTGDRIAQIVIQPCCMWGFEEAKELSNTERGSGGFGSTGRNAIVKPKTKEEVKNEK